MRTPTISTHHIFLLACTAICCIICQMVVRAENLKVHQGFATRSIQKYDFISDIHQDTLLSAVPTSLMNVGHGTVAWGDYNNDGQLDILLTGITDRFDSSRTDSSRHVSKIYRNENSSFVDIEAHLAGVNNNDGTIWCDYDRDGYLDLFIGGATREPNADCISKIYRYNGTDFTDIQVQIPGVVGTAAWGDFDGDGNLDLIIAGSPDNGGTFITKLYKNDNGNFIEMQADLPGVWGASIAWGDYNNDGRADLLLIGYGTYGVTSKIFRNDGPSGDTGWVFTDINAPLARVNSGSVAWGDYDADGNLDILLSGYLIGGSGGFTTIYKGDGNGNFFDINPHLIGVGNSMVSWKDFDNDGDLDVLVSGQTPSGDLITKLYQNDNGTYTDIGASLEGVWYSAAAWGDYDNDGRLDLLVTGFSKSDGEWPYKPITMLYHNNCQIRDSLPTVPNSLVSHVSGSSVTLQWEKATHNRTPQAMLTYNILLGTSTQGGQIVPAMSDPATGYHRVARTGNLDRRNLLTLNNLPPGMYYWSVQTVDNANAASAFTQEKNFTVGSPQVATEWRMISIPAIVPDFHTSALFPEAVSPAFGYTDRYLICDELMNGSAYWLKLPKTYHMTISGEPLTADTISINEGWNMIGSISSPVSTDIIASIPGGITTSQFYSYDGTYHFIDTIQPGGGYWVKADRAGVLILSSSLQTAGNLIRITPHSDVPPAPPEEGTTVPRSVPREFSLEQNYPNPFNPSTEISFVLPRTSVVMLRVYNMLGQEVAVLLNHEVLQEGLHRVLFSAAGQPAGGRDIPSLSSGVYIYHIDVNELTAAGTSYRDTRKMILLK